MRSANTPSWRVRAQRLHKYTRPDDFSSRRKHVLHQNLMELWSSVRAAVRNHRRSIIGIEGIQQSG